MDDNLIDGAELQEFDTALEEAMDTVVTVSKMNDTVVDEPLMSEANCVALQTAVEHFCNRLGVKTVSIGTEGYVKQFVSTESFTDTLKTIIDTIIKVIKNFIQKLKEFALKILNLVSESELRLEAVRKTLSGKNTLAANPNVYKTNNLRSFMKESTGSVKALDTVALIHNLKDFMSSTVEFKIDAKVNEALAKYEELAKVLNKNDIDESNLFDSVLPVFKLLFGTSHLSTTNINDEHEEEYHLYFNNDILLSSYKIESLYTKPSTPEIQLIAPNHALEREAIIRATNGHELMNLVDVLAEILKQNKENAKVIDRCAIAMTKLNNELEKIKVKDEKELTIKAILAKNILRAVTVLKDYAVLMTNRNNRLVKDHCAFIEAVA